MVPLRGRRTVTAGAQHARAGRVGMSSSRAEAAGPASSAAAGGPTAPARPGIGQPAGPDQAGDLRQPGDPRHRAPAGQPVSGPRQRAVAAARRLRTPLTRRAAAHLLLVVGFIGAGIAVTWPMTAKLADGQLLKVPDVSSYVWALWWMAHQIAHLGDPWFTQYMAAPTGIQLGFDTLMPLPGLIMTPVTLVFGPAASFDLLTIVTPGLLCYGTYRAARLWLGQPGAIGAGAFFGLATMATWQDLYHLNIAVGTLFLPLALEAAVRLQRCPGRRQGIILGLVLGASVLTNQESAVVAALLAAAVLVPWLIRLAARKPGITAARHPLRTLALGAVVAVIVASPQLLAMIRQVADGGAAVGANELTQTYREYGVGLPTLFAPSPRLGHFQLGHLAASYQFAEPTEGIPTFGIVLAVLAVIGLALTWRRAYSWWLAVLWLAGAALALGPALIIGTRTFIPLASHWHGVKVSLLMPYTWLVRIPGLSALREADRLALLGLLGAAILAGAAIQWVCQHARPVIATAVIIVVAVAGFLEAGWSATGAPTMPTAMPSLDGPIAADRSHSVVVDVPFGLRGGVGLTGFAMRPQSLILATADGHPRAISYTSWVPRPTRNGIWDNPFYRCLYRAQNGHRTDCHGQVLINARRGARRADIGWVIVWHKRIRAARPTVIAYLYATGFHIDYQVDSGNSGITVWHRR
jgi:hypothetical protein